MLSRRNLAKVARLVLGAFLLSQAALAIAACQSAERAPADAVRYAAGADAPPCHESTPADSERSFCVGHCTANLQTLDKPPVPVVALPASPLLFVVPTASFSPALPAAPQPANGPPPRIRFQSLQI